MSAPTLPRTNARATSGKLARVENERDEAVSWLRAISHDVAALRRGERNGHVFGVISGTDDAIQDFLARIDGN